MPLLRRKLLLTVAGLATLRPLPLLAATPTTRRDATSLAMVLPAVYDDRIDPALCLVSEKYDGVRAFWDGHSLRHRSGRPVAAPSWFTDALPAEPLDGELWLGRRRFDALSAIVRSAPADDAAWRDVRYMIFELPGAAGSVDARAHAIQAIVDRSAGSPLRAVAQERVADRPALRRRLAATVSMGGEGLVLHLASAPYTTGRSDVLTKLKPFLDDEATVIGYRPGRGKYEGDAGALKVQTPDGRRFFLGSGLPDDLRRRPPAPGTVVTYRYHDLTGTGLPRFASFLRLHEAL